jgi:hypothetical protein
MLDVYCEEVGLKWRKISVNDEFCAQRSNMGFHNTGYFERKLSAAMLLVPYIDYIDVS